LKIETIIASEVPPFLLENPNQGCRKPHYDEIAEALLSTRPGDWIRIALTDLPAPKTGDNKRMQGTLMTAMRVRKVGRIKTRIGGAHLFITVVRDKKPPVAK